MAPIDPIPEVPVPQPVSRYAGIGEASRNVLVRFVVDVWNRVKRSVAETLRYAVDSTLETLERPLLSMARPLLDKALSTPGIPPEIRSILERARSGQDQVGAIVLAFVVIFVLPPIISALFSGPVELVRFVSNKTFRPNRLDFGTWFQAALRDPGYASAMIRELQDQGWTDEQMGAARLVAEQRLGVQEVFAARVRGLIGDGEMSQRLTRLGIVAADAGILQRLVEQIPGPSDLVRFGLREAWRDDIASKYGYDQGQPGEMTEWLEKQGYGPEWAQAFWRSHWEIPSVGQMIEMFHRQEIEYGDLVQGLRTNDVAPGWIDPLLGITYNLLTRVDVKRALRYGEYSVDDVFEEYRLLGYGENRARILTNIAVRESLDDAAGLTRAAIVAAYKKGRLERGEAIESLGDIGILGDVAEFYLDQADFDRAESLLDRRVGNVEKRYKAGLLSDNQALEELGALGLGGEEARLNVEDWALSRKTMVRRPTRANLDEFVRQGIVGPDTYRTELARMGYDPQYIGWYVGSLSFEASSRAAKEEERAQKERVRILADRRSTDYEKGKAEIDRDIAELNAAIADAQVALVESQNERDQRLTQSLPAREIAELDRQYKPLFREVDAAVASARLAIQERRSDVAGLNGQINDFRRSLAAGRDIVEDTKLRNERAALATQGALYDQQIAQRKTDIARLTEAIPLAESAEQQADFKQTILTLKTEVAEFEEKQADDKVRVEEIGELLPVQLTAVRRAEIEAGIRGLQSQIDEYRLQVEDLGEGIRQTQIERLTIERRYKTAVEAVPGRAEQIEIRAEYEARIDVIQARIVELRSDVARRRLAKTDLVVGWRS
jgi:hypothetical protein